MIRIMHEQPALQSNIVATLDAPVYYSSARYHVCRMVSCFAIASFNAFTNLHPPMPLSFDVIFEYSQEGIVPAEIGQCIFCETG
jgi:hypothetical protein